MQRRYSDREKATALAVLDANNGDALATARQTGIPRSTIRHWVSGNVSADVAGLRQEKKAELSARLDELAHALVGDLLQESKRSQASYKDLATAMGIAIDKARLLRGQSTQNTTNCHQLDLNKLSTEDLETIERIATSLQG
jgi:transposase-like protein